MAALPTLPPSAPLELVQIQMEMQMQMQVLTVDLCVSLAWEGIWSRMAEAAWLGAATRPLNCRLAIGDLLICDNATAIPQLLKLNQSSLP